MSDSESNEFAERAADDEDEVLDLTAIASADKPSVSRTPARQDGGAPPAATAPRLATRMPLCTTKGTLARGRTTMLVEIPNPSFDLSGDVGAIGRVTVLPREGVLLDVKGVCMTGHIVPAPTAMIVSMGATEARVECVVADFVRMHSFANVLEAMSGVLTSGSIDPAHTLTHDDEDAMAVLRARKAKKGEDAVSSDDDEAEPGAAGDERTGAGKKRARASAGAHTGTHVKPKPGRKPKAKTTPKPRATAKAAMPTPAKQRTPKAKAPAPAAKPRDNSDSDADTAQDEDVPVPPRSSAKRARTAVRYEESSDSDDSAADSAETSDASASASDDDDDFSDDAPKRSSGKGKRSGSGKSPAAARPMLGRRVQVKKGKGQKQLSRQKAKS